MKTVKSFIQNWDGVIIHLTMYGEQHDNTLRTLRLHENENLLLIVGGAKVPQYIYEISDFNTAVGWQPHSEVSAIAIFLHSIRSTTLYEQFDGAQIAIVRDGYKSKRSGRFNDHSQSA